MFIPNFRKKKRLCLLGTVPKRVLKDQHTQAQCYNSVPQKIDVERLVNAEIEPDIESLTQQRTREPANQRTRSFRLDHIAVNAQPLLTGGDREVVVSLLAGQPGAHEVEGVGDGQGNRAREKPFVCVTDRDNSHTVVQLVLPQCILKVTPAFEDAAHWIIEVSGRNQAVSKKSYFQIANYANLQEPLTISRALVPCRRSCKKPGVCIGSPNRPQAVLDCLEQSVV